MPLQLVVRSAGLAFAAVTLGCSEPKDDNEAATVAAIEDACSGQCLRSGHCGLHDEVVACTQECVESLSSSLDSKRTCVEADVLVYQCLSVAPCETLPSGSTCEEQIERSKQACGGGSEPETSSG